MLRTSGPKENEQHIRDYVAAKAEEWLRAAGAVEVMRIPLPRGGADNEKHSIGSAHAGDAREVSVAGVSTADRIH